MTITLTWWMLPILLIIGGWLYAWYDEKHDTGMFYRGMGGMFVFVICFVFAIAFTIGHFV